jgi:hypothetical protein
MSELAEAWKAVHDRHEAIGDSLDLRPLFSGFDVQAGDVNDAAIAYAEACGEGVFPEGSTVDIAAAWCDGFTVGAMLFLRRLERR